MVLIVLAVMIAVTTISHLAHGAADQSLTVGRSVVDIVESGEPVQNIGGAFGANCRRCSWPKDSAWELLCLWYGLQS